MSEPFTLCTTVGAVEGITKELSTNPYLLLNCQGNALGLRGGELSIITLGTADASTIYLFDVLKIGHEGLTPIWKLLENDDQMKLVWDGRGQLGELHSSFGVNVSHFIDLQLVEVESVGRKKTIRRSRVKNYFGDQLVDRHPKLFGSVQCAVGLHEYLESLGFSIGDAELKSASSDQAGWTQRPLPHDLSEYSACQIRHLSLIYNDFVAKDYIQPEDTRNFEWLSQAHASPFPDYQRPEAGNIFRTSSVFPFELVDGRSLAGEKCLACGRILPLDCFDIEEIIEAPFAGTLDDDNTDTLSILSDHRLMRRERCNPCRAIALKHGLPDGGYTVECSVTYSDEEAFELEFDDLDTPDWQDDPLKRSI